MGAWWPAASRRAAHEDSVLHVIEVESGTQHDLAIERVPGVVYWLADSSGFLYSQLAAPQPDAPPSARYLNSVVRLHRLGTDPQADPIVFGSGIHAAVAMDPIAYPFVEASADGRWLIGLVVPGTQAEVELYIAPAAGLADPATCPWCQVATVDDAVIGYALCGDTLYLLTQRDAPRRTVSTARVQEPDLATATVVVPQTERVIKGIHVVGDVLLTRDLAVGAGRLRRVDPQGGAIVEVPLPVEGTIAAWAGESSAPDLLLELMSWTVSARLYRYDTIAGTIKDTGWLPPSAIDMSAVEAHEVMATAADGTAIPLSIIHRRGLPRDGRHPALLVAYGSYGLIAYPPSFTPALRSGCTVSVACMVHTDVPTAPAAGCPRPP